MRRARLRQGEERSALILRAGEWVNKAMRVRAGSGWHALPTCAYVLFSRNKYMPGEETDRLLGKAHLMFEAALQAGVPRGDLIGRWGVVH